MAQQQAVPQVKVDKSEAWGKPLSLFFFIVLVIIWLVGNVYANMVAIYELVEWVDARNGASSIEWIRAQWTPIIALIIALAPSTGQAYYQQHKGLHRLEGMKRAIPILVFIAPATIIDLAASTVGIYTGAFSMSLDVVHYGIYGIAAGGAFIAGILAQGAAHSVLNNHLLVWWQLDDSIEPEPDMVVNFKPSK